MAVLSAPTKHKYRNWVSMPLNLSLLLIGGEQPITSFLWIFLRNEVDAGVVGQHSLLS